MALAFTVFVSEYRTVENKKVILTEMKYAEKYDCVRARSPYVRGFVP